MIDVFDTTELRENLSETNMAIKKNSNYVPDYVLDPEAFRGSDYPDVDLSPIVTSEDEEVIRKFYDEHPQLKTPLHHIHYSMGGSEEFHSEEPWIQTYSGRRFTPTNPMPDAVVIQDIAHSLSMQCRFSGHTKKFYCVTPDTRILTSDLKWKKAGELNLFDGLVGFDENTGEDDVFSNNRKSRRKMKYANVLHTGLIKRHVYALHLNNGTILKSSDEHPWLISSKKSKNQKWETTAEIVNAIKNGKQRYMLQFLDPWDHVADNRDIGYLEGIFDGEGTINCNRKGFLISIAQKPGPVLDKIANLLTKYNFSFSKLYHKSGVCNLQLKGSWYDRLRFLGTFCPVRLLNKYKSHLRSGEWRKEFNSIKMLTINRVEDLGIQDVVALETSSKTYFAEGFGSHNSVAQHCVLVSYICNMEDALWGLLHDASEAYLVDLPSPLKRSGQIEGYIKFEKKMQEAICKRFGLSFEEPNSVRKADKILLATEARDLMSPLRTDWSQPCEPLPFKIDALPPQEAKNLYMRRFFELTNALGCYSLYLKHEAENTI